MDIEIKEEIRNAEGLGIFGYLAGFFLFAYSIFTLGNMSPNNLEFLKLFAIWFVYIVAMKWCWKVKDVKWKKLNGDYRITKNKKSKVSRKK